MEDSALNLFDGILYINLEMRKDRKTKIKREFKKVGLHPDKIHRIEGLLDELNGTRACAYSHAEALDFAIRQGWKNVLILEDDCLFVKPLSVINNYIHTFFEQFEENWDVFLGAKSHVSTPTPHRPLHPRPILPRSPRLRRQWPLSHAIERLFPLRLQVDGRRPLLHLLF